MIPQDNAAKFFILAWVRCWTVTQLANTLLENSEIRKVPSEEDLQKVIDTYAFMPREHDLYWRNTLMRTYVAATYPKLSDWLFAHQDNAERIKILPQVANLKPRATKIKSVCAEAAKLIGTANRNYEFNKQEAAVRKTHARSAWNVCKA